MDIENIGKTLEERIEHLEEVVKQYELREERKTLFLKDFKGLLNKHKPPRVEVIDVFLDLWVK